MIKIVGQMLAHLIQARYFWAYLLNTDMICSTKTTEDRIKEAAKTVFLEKGFDGTTTRDIAKAADINSALMNYYFRSKEKLFQAIFTDVCTLMFEGMVDMLGQPIALQEKIAALIDQQFLMMMKNPGLTIFIMNELHRNPERMFASISLAKKLLESTFQQQVNEAAARGQIVPIPAVHILTMIIANTHFLFVSKPMTMLTQGIDEAGFDAFARQHLAYVKDMVCAYLFTPLPVS